MDLEPWRLPPLLAWGAFLPALVLLGLLLARLGRPGARAALARHVPLAATVAVLVLWQLRASVEPAPAVHLLGAALLTLVLGPALAAVAMLVVVAAATLDGAGGWSTLAVNWLITGALPVWVSTLVLGWARARLPDNPFVYILVCGFAGGGVSMAAVGLVSGLVLLAVTPLDLATVIKTHWSTYLLLVFPEAFLTGSTIAWMSMFYPAAVATYSDPAPRTG